MSKAALISIQPKWCELIASGEKTLEVRKNRPKLEIPFKCYIYCTKFKYGEILCFPQWKTGKVIGEFVCDKIVPIKVFPNGTIQNYMFYDLDQTMLPYDDIAKYIGDGRDGCGWHISNLVIYDKPKELSDFRQCHKCPYGDYENCNQHEYSCNGDYKMKRPPQSWCYVEELKGGAK